MADQGGPTARDDTTPEQVNELNNDSADEYTPQPTSQVAQAAPHFNAPGGNPVPNWFDPSRPFAPFAPAAPYPNFFGNPYNWEGSRREGPSCTQFREYWGVSPHLSSFAPAQGRPNPSTFEQFPKFDTFTPLPPFPLFPPYPLFPPFPPINAQFPPPGIPRIQPIPAGENQVQGMAENQRQGMNAFPPFPPMNAQLHPPGIPRIQPVPVGKDQVQNIAEKQRQDMNADPLATDQAKLNAQTRANMNKQKGKKGRYGHGKIMLPAPQPTDAYLTAASKEPRAVPYPKHILVILDLNGTLIFRPNPKNPKHLIARPFLTQFLRYLFENGLSVMVWSSARPDNVNAIVQNVLDKDMRELLVGCWGRDTFGLNPVQYNQNVQVYKNLKLVWEAPSVQYRHPYHTNGGSFDQHNTVLIDDTSLKATAQPYNLIEIPEFSGTPAQKGDDVLREVAGYLDAMRKYQDVSTFMKKCPFKADGTWQLDWDVAGDTGGEMSHKVSLGSTRSH